ncbi:MAG: tetratricopeptide repeat protein [Candidatus Eisenbacteria bacterium]
MAAAALWMALTGCAHMVVLHDPLNADEHNNLGVAYESSGKLDLAVKEYRKSVRLDAHQGHVWVNLGNVEAAQGRWRDAEKSYRRALREDPADSDAMNNLAVALLRQQRNRDEALTLAERALAAGGPRDSVYRATLDEVKRNGRE